MLRYFTHANLRKIFFSDESIFTVEGRYNAHNDVFYTYLDKKEDVDEERLHHSRNQFPKSVMVSAAISNLGKTSLFLIEQGVCVDSDYYCHNLLSSNDSRNGSKYHRTEYFTFQLRRGLGPILQTYTLAT